MRPQDLGIGKLFETVRDAVIVADASTGRIVLWNPAASEIFGYSSSEALDGLDVEALVPERLKERHRAGLSRYHDTGHGPYIDSYAVLDLPAVRKGGEEIRVELTLSPIEPLPEAEAEGRFVLAVVRDATERKEAEEALRESEEFFRALYEDVRHPIFLLDRDLNFVDANPHACEFYGYGREEFKRMRVPDIVVPEELSDHREAAETMLREGEVLVPERRHRKKDGGIVTVTVDVDRVARSGEEMYVAKITDITERVRAEEALKESERRFSTLLGNAPAMVYRCTNEPRWPLQFVSSYATELTGYAAVDFTNNTGLEYGDLILEAEQGRVWDEVQAALNRHERFTIGYPIRRKDGTIRHVEEVGQGIYDQNGNVVAIEGFVTDVTERRRAEEEIRKLNEELEGRVAERTAELEAAVARLQSSERNLRQSEERFRLLVEGVEDYAIFMLDPQGRITTWNLGAERIKGYKAEEVLGKHFSLFYPREDLERGHPEEELRVAAEEGSYEEEGWRVRKDGSRFWANVVITALRDKAGGLRGFSKVTRDVTERKRAEEALRRGEERYRAVVEQAGEGIFLFDPRSKRILEANPAFREMFGYSAQEVRGITLYDLAPHDPEGVDRNVGRALEQGHLLVGERRYRRKDCSKIDVEVSGGVISYGGEQVICSVVRDVTERKRAEEAMVKVREAERNRMARDLHDGALQDLTYALAEAQIMKMLSEDPNLDERLDRQIGALKRSAQELREAVYGLLPTGAEDRPLPERLGLLVEASSRISPGCDISLEVVEGFPSAPSGEGATELLRIVQEALTNARKHSGAENVRVSLKTEGDDLVAEVEDDGRGFEPGTGRAGVGLRSMNERAAALGGQLEVESELEKGTRVRFRTPLRNVGGGVTG